MNKEQIAKHLIDFVAGIKETYRNSEGKKAKPSQDLIALSVTMEIKRLEKK